MIGAPGVEHLDVDVGDGLRLHAARSGEGPPLLLLHGFTGSGDTWAPLSAALGGRYATIAVDLAGHGRSSAPDDPARYALDRAADDLARVLDAIDVQRAATLGYSMGGRTALHFALRHPERVEALVLESSSPGIARDAERAERLRADAELAAFLEREGIAAFVERWEALPLWSSQAALPDSVRAALRAERLRNNPRGLANSLRGAGAAAAPSVLDRLAAITAPTLLIAGELDEKYVALGREMQEALPRARLLVVPHAGHAVHLEQPDPFAQAIEEFLATPTKARGMRGI